MKGRTNPVAKNMNEFNKPKIERDRKKNPSRKQVATELAERIKDGDRPHRLEPYVRCPTNKANLLLDWNEDDEL